jgi:hypothetical protein
VADGSGAPVTGRDGAPVMEQTADLMIQQVQLPKLDRADAGG